MARKNKIKRERRFVSPQLKDKVRSRDNWECRICAVSADKLDSQIEVHHIRPMEMGGRDRFNNMITLCHDCHSGVHYDRKSVEFWIAPLREYVQMLKDTGKHHTMSEVVSIMKSEGFAFDGRE